MKRGGYDARELEGQLISRDVASRFAGRFFDSSFGFVSASEIALLALSAPTLVVGGSRDRFYPRNAHPHPHGREGCGAPPGGRRAGRVARGHRERSQPRPYAEGDPHLPQHVAPHRRPPDAREAAASQPKHSGARRSGRVPASSGQRRGPATPTMQQPAPCPHMRQGLPARVCPLRTNLYRPGCCTVAVNSFDHPTRP